MPTGRTCGNCLYFARIKTFSGKRNGLCDKEDSGTHADNSACTKYSRKKYKRIKATPILTGQEAVDFAKRLEEDLKKPVRLVPTPKLERARELVKKYRRNIFRARN